MGQLDDVNMSGKNNVYINENMTKANRNLLYHAKRFQKENDWKHAWLRNGTILLGK